MAKPALSSWRAGRSSNVLTASCGHRPVRPIPRKSLRELGLSERRKCEARKLLILWYLRSWLAALDDFRKWLIREAA